MTDRSASIPRQSVADLAAKRNALRRRVKAWQLLAGKCVRAVRRHGREGLPRRYGRDRKARRRFLPQHLTTTIERCRYRRGMGALVLVLVYDLVKTVFVQQLEAMLVEMRDSPEAAQGYGKAPGV